MLVDIQFFLVYVSEINAVTDEVTRGEEMFYNVVREDIVTREPGSHTKEVLREAPEVEGDYVKVKQVLKQ